jgi:hypothetical protein
MAGLSILSDYGLIGLSINQNRSEGMKDLSMRWKKITNNIISLINVRAAAGLAEYLPSTPQQEPYPNSTELVGADSTGLIFGAIGIVFVILFGAFLFRKKHR